MMDSFVTATIYLVTTSLIPQIIVGVVFPMLVLGLGIKFMRNLGRP